MNRLAADGYEVTLLPGVPVAVARIVGKARVIFQKDAGGTWGPVGARMPDTDRRPAHTRQLNRPILSNVYLPHEAAEELRIGKTLLYRLLQSGELKSFKVGDNYRIQRSALDEYIARNAPAPIEPTPAEELKDDPIPALRHLA